MAFSTLRASVRILLRTWKFRSSCATDCRCAFSADVCLPVFSFAISSPSPAENCPFIWEVVSYFIDGTAVNERHSRSSSTGPLGGHFYGRDARLANTRLCARLDG